MIDQGEAGWFQTVHVRGGDIDQVGYELDGIPSTASTTTRRRRCSRAWVVRKCRFIPAACGQRRRARHLRIRQSGHQDRHVSGLWRRDAGVGNPAFYHQASIEAGGSTPDRLFSYYVGIGGSNQDFRYVDNNNGASIPNSFFYPVSAVPGNTCGPKTCTSTATPTGSSIPAHHRRSSLRRASAFRWPHSLYAIRLLTSTSASRTARRAARRRPSALHDQRESQPVLQLDKRFGANTVEAFYGPLTWDDTYSTTAR